MKLKTLIHDLIISHICRITRAFSKAKSFLLEIFKENQLIFLNQTHKKNKKIYRNKILFGSFRLHYNWCSSSHVLPISSSPSNNIILGDKNGNTPTTSSPIYYDSTWNSIFSTDDDDHHHHQGQLGNLGNKEEGDDLATYLQWLEEKGGKDENSKDDKANIEDEIDKLADMFIASCHEKFRLEKIESYRRYQAMLARTG